MANIRVTCPACKSELEIGAEYAGQEVECGNCLEVFTAKAPGRSSSAGTGGTADPETGSASASGSGRSEPADRPARKKRRDDDDDYEHDRRRRDDDDDDDDAPRRRRRRRGSSGNGLATTSLILGITAIFPGCCCYLFIPLSVGAIATGSIALKHPEGKGMAIAGIVLGGCALALYTMLLLLNFGLGGMNNPGRFR